MSRVGLKRRRAVALSAEIIDVLASNARLSQDEARAVVMGQHQVLADYMNAWQRRVWAAFNVPLSAMRSESFSGLGDIIEGDAK